MAKKIVLSGAAALLAGAAFAAPRAGIRERYFGQGWARVEPAQAVAAPAPPPAAGGGQDLHAPAAHMDITRKAFELYAARYGGGELERYIGDARDGAPVPDNEGTVVGGSYDEDAAFKNPWGQMFPMANHFWDCREGYYKGWEGNDSGVNRAHKYWSGGFGIENEYDSGWGSGGVQGEGVIGLYRKGEKAKAYWYLGHVAHLLEDLTVPAHALLFTHVGEGADAYETYMKHHFAEWSPAPGETVESFSTLYDLFYKTADITNDFDAGSGPDSGADGKKDNGARRAGGFTDAQLKEEGSVLMPLAYKRVAALFLFFFKQIDKAPPTVTLDDPASGSSDVELAARAVDEQSGVDKRGYRFEFLALDGNSEWKSVTAATSGPGVHFTGEPGLTYAFRVTAADAAGNRATSPVKYWRAGAPAVARL